MAKVLHIMNSLLPSGAETMLYSSADYWDKKLDKHILATASEVGVYANTLESVGYKIHHIHEKNKLAQYKAVVELIKDEDFNIVHIHRQAQAFSYALCAKLGGAEKLVRTVHNVFVFHGAVQIREYITRQCACLMGVKHIAIGKSVYENEKKRFGVECNIVNNWYNEKKFYYMNEQMKNNARKKLKISRGTYCIVSVGNCSSVKNHMSILKALNSIIEKGNLSDVLYLHLGKGAQEEEEKFYVKEQGLERYVHFIGFADPVAYLQAADLFVMPSTYEGVGISALEAMATGTCTLLTNVPGLKDFAQHAFKNVYYSALEDKKFEEILNELIQDRVTQCSELQSQQVNAIYGIRSGVEGYQKVYGII